MISLFNIGILLSFTESFESGNIQAHRTFTSTISGLLAETKKTESLVTAVEEKAIHYLIYVEDIKSACLG